MSGPPSPIDSWAAAEPEWASFAEYCRLREQGLRRKALVALRQFIVAASQWPFDERLRFMRWARDFAPYGRLMPQPLLDGLFRPTVAEWQAREPDKAEPHLWAGEYGDGSEPSETHFRRALKCDPTCEGARRHLIQILLHKVNFAQHHLPQRYLGDAQTDLRILHEVRVLLDAVTEPSFADVKRAELEEYDALAHDWQQFGIDGGTDFARWCAAKNRSYRWLGAIYYKK